MCVHLIFLANEIVYTSRGSLPLFYLLLLYAYHNIFENLYVVITHQTPKRGILKGHFSHNRVLCVC
jgi:hypothetical protein